MQGASALFYFIGNTVIHSCVKVEPSYEIKNAPRGCAARGRENIALANRSRAENLASEILFYTFFTRLYRTRVEEKIHKRY